jgi:phage shock protein PspC (stress-responsive transcriptional regulator)
MLVGTLTLGLAIAAVGQAVQGNGSDRLFFPVYAAALIAATGGIYARVARYTRPEVLGMSGGLAAYLAADVYWTQLISAAIGVFFATFLYTVASLRRARCTRCRVVSAGIVRAGNRARFSGGAVSGSDD